MPAACTGVLEHGKRVVFHAGNLGVAAFRYPVRDLLASPFRRRLLRVGADASPELTAFAVPLFVLTGLAEEFVCPSLVSSSGSPIFAVSAVGLRTVSARRALARFGILLSCGAFSVYQLRFGRGHLEHDASVGKQVR
jgi:hypothetical protein